MGFCLFRDGMKSFENKLVIALRFRGERAYRPGFPKGAEKKPKFFPLGV